MLRLQGQYKNEYEKQKQDASFRCIF